MGLVEFCIVHTEPGQFLLHVVENLILHCIRLIEIELRLHLAVDERQQALSMHLHLEQMPVDFRELPELVSLPHQIGLAHEVSAAAVSEADRDRHDIAAIVGRAKEMAVLTRKRAFYPEQLIVAPAQHIGYIQCP